MKPSRAKVIAATKGALRGRGAIRAALPARAWPSMQRERELKARLKRARTATVRPKGRLPNPKVCPICGRAAGAPYRRYDSQGRVIYGCIDGFHTGHLVTPSESSRWHNRKEAKAHRAAVKKHLAINPGFFGEEATRKAKRVTKIRRVQERDTKQAGEIVDVLPGGFIKVKWDNRERPTLIKRSEIKRYPYLRNPRRQQKLKPRSAREVARRGEIVYQGGDTLVIYNKRTGQDEQWENVKTGEADYNKMVYRISNPGLLDLVGGMQALDYLSSKVTGKKNPKRKNPSIREMSQRFQGKATGKAEDYYFSDRAPGLDFSRGGKLVFIKLQGKQIRIPDSIVAIDPKAEKLWLGCKSANGMFKRKAKPGEQLDYGDVDAICYLTAKAHIGNNRTYEYVHAFGEEGGRKPKLLVDHDGMPILKGGDYTIEDRGIVN